MKLIKVNQNQTIDYPYSSNQLKLDYPNTSFPENISIEFLKECGVLEVIEVPHSNNPYVNYKELEPQLIDNLWYQRWEEVPMNSSQIEWINSNKWLQIRSMRNQYLAETDWTQLFDSPLIGEAKENWIQYRQSLRDITDQEDPFNIIWPTKPE